MALTRKMLKAMGIEDEKIDQIVEEHAESVDALKAQRDQWRDKAEEAAKKAGEQAADEDGWKAKYEAKAKELENWKAQAQEKADKAEKRRLYRAELEELGIVGKRADAVVKATDLSEVEVEGGKLADREAVRKAIESEWAEFIPHKRTEGANVPNPPAGSKATKSREEIAKMKNPRERQAAYAELLAQEGE